MIHIKYNKIENEKKFTKVMLQGAKLKIVNEPSKKGRKYTTKNLLFNIAFKLNPIAKLLI